MEIDRSSATESPPARDGAEPARPRVRERAQALLREQLANGPKPASQIEAAAEAAEIPEHSLIDAADALGVRTQRKRWWLPG